MSVMEGYLDSFDTLNTRQFLIVIKKLATTLSYGTDHSPFLGSGIEYVQSRPYMPGDPVRHIDWRVTARTRKFYVKEFESPKRMPCYLMVDTSASMAISSQKRSKYATALHIAGGLALACLDRVSPVGVVGVGDQNIRIRPSLSKNQILRWVLMMRRFRYDEGTTLGRRIREFTPSLKHRALVIVLSDLHDDQALPALKRLSQLHDCAVLQFRDPAEDGLRGSGILRGRESETGREFVTTGRGNWVDQVMIDEALKKSGIDHLVIQNDLPFLHSLKSFFETRGLLGRGAR